MDKLQLTEQNLCRVFNSGHDFMHTFMHTMHRLCSVEIRPNLELKTRPKQLLDYLPLYITLPDQIWPGSTFIDSPESPPPRPLPRFCFDETMTEIKRSTTATIVNFHQRKICN